MNTTTEEHLGVIIADDDPVFLDIVCATLKKASPFVVFEAKSGDEVLDLLGRQRIDCVVLDYDLGLETGLTVKQRIEDSRPERVPLVMLTGSGRESTAIRAFRMGFADYVPKRDLQTAHLVRTVVDAVGRSRRERSEEAERRRLFAASSTDAVTGLEGRTRLDERLDALATLPAAALAKYALTLVEVVDYDAMVGRYGFKMADQALKLIGKKLSALTRSGDVCGRYEGGSFLVIADNGTDGELLHRICCRFAEQLTMRFTSDVADLQLLVRVAAAPAAPLGDVREAGGRHPALGPATRAIEEARASGAAVTVVGTTPRASEAGRAGPDLGPAPATFEFAASRATSEESRSENRRRNPRQKVLRRGLIHLLGKQSTINCTVRNTSLDGMGLRLEAPCAVPESFDLEILGSGTRERVNVRWQASRDLGVEIASARLAP